VIKAAFGYGLLNDGEAWMDMLERRNFLLHTYDEKTFETAFLLVQGTYRSAVSALMDRLTAES